MADALNISRAETLGVISFYHDFRRSPVDGRVLKLCRAESCQAMGCEDLVSHLERRHGIKADDADDDARASRRNRSIASAIARSRRPRCSTANRSAGSTAIASTRSSPAPKGRRNERARFRSRGFFGAVGRRGRRRARNPRRSAPPRPSTSSSCAPDRAASFGSSRWSRSRPPPAASAMVRSRRARRLSCSRPASLSGGAHPKALGRVDDIPYLARQQRLIFARCGLTDPLSIDDYRRHGGLKGLERALALGPKATVEEVLASGLRGRGGAGFPTGIKWRTTAGVDADQKYVVCNADEGDSGTFADRMLMEGDPFLLIEGMAIAAVDGRRDQGLCLYPLRISARLRHVSSGRSSGRGRRDCSARACLARPMPSISRRGSAPAPISAARRRRFWRAWRASAGKFAPSRRCPRSSACSASRPSSTMC